MFGGNVICVGCTRRAAAVQHGWQHNNLAIFINADSADSNFTLPSGGTTIRRLPMNNKMFLNLAEVPELGIMDE